MKNKTKQIEKPKLVQSEPYYNWNDIERYFKSKYKIEIRDYKYADKTYDLWHWLIDKYEVYNGLTIKLRLYEEWKDELPDYAKSFFEILKKEFETDIINVRVSW